MSIAIAARIARRELRGGIKGFRVFLACLALGIAAIAAVGTVREGITRGLEREGASMLGGDVSIKMTYRYMGDEGRQWFDSLGPVSEIVDFRSMAVVPREGDSERALTQVKGVDAAYPLYGSVALEPEIPLAVALDGQGGLPGAVMDRVLMDRLGLTPGDTFRLGTQDFAVMAVLTREPDSGAGGFGLGPRTLVRASALKGSGLLSPGTLFEAEYRLRLPPETDLDALEAEADTRLSDVGFRWRDRRNGAPGISRFVDRLSAFLVLVGLAGLAVGGVGVAAAVRAHLERKTATIATLKTLGAEGRTIFLIYLIQIAVLTVIGIILGLIIGAAAPLLFAPLISAALPVPTAFALYPAPLAQAALYGALTALLFTLWPLARTERVRAAALYRDAAGAIHGVPRPFFIALTGVVLLALVAVAALLSGLAMLTVYAALGLGAAFVALLGAAALVRHLARAAARATWLRGHSALRMALGSVGGPSGEAASVVLSLGLGLTVLAAVGQIDANLRGAIARDLPDVAPSYFMVDIQPDQMEAFRTRLTNDPGVSKVDTAPMMRGVVTRINGEDATKVAGDHWVVRGDRGITYAAVPGEDTTITAGEWWPENYTGPPQVSFAAEEAAEIGLSLGDTITVNVLGRDIDATITSFREVDFSTAGIGFVLTLNPAALAGAPHTFIATIYADEASEAAILRDLASAFPNITAIRVRDAIDRVTDILGGIAAAITYGALATLITGAVVLIGAAAAGERARTYEAAVLKTLGASRATILTSFALRSAILGAAAGLVAIVTGGLAGWGVSHFVMETDFVFEPVSAVLIVLGGILVTLLAGLAFAWRPMAARPARVLRSAE
ncbi:ABC transporter permease [Oceaniovalibus sp. ACAM 378]|uniref:ABC transporter permease n=1 Tax=Oceaniovalibus sp. ACAM 378 TaxID=2599923 RepID=UPI0011D8CDEB|nr:FtsX-like permease family protein [Oceaniovalibus sp. ACAM 378]TYB86354.1 FtsX-like permease family protein [Oceaniovalibus sp. ACAM 378]